MKTFELFKATDGGDANEYCDAHLSFSCDYISLIVKTKVLSPKQAILT